MMKTELLLRGALLIGGLLTAVVGTGHLFMPALGYDSSVSLAMDPAVRDHFYYLSTYAIGAFLLSFAFLSIYFSRLRDCPASVVVGSVLAVFWIARMFLEFRYPVEIRIFFLQEPHRVLLPIIVFLALIYSVSAIMSWNSLGKLSRHPQR